jgi:hypothetical protein
VSAKPLRQRAALLVADNPAIEKGDRITVEALGEHAQLS